MRGLSDSNEMQALVKKKMSKISDEVYLLADGSKFGLQAFSKVVPIEEIDFIITDSNTSPEQLQEFGEYAAKVIHH